MTIKSAAFLALMGTILLTILFLASLVGDVLGIVKGLIPAVRLLTSLIFTFAGLSVAVFFYVFHKTQP